MANGEHLKPSLPYVAASDVNPRTAVGAAAAIDNGAVPLTAATVEPVGVVGPATALRTEAVTVYGDGAVIEVTAAASLGAGGDVGVASGGFSPVVGASGVTRFRTGIARESAAAGERFSLYVRPKQLSNLI